MLETPWLDFLELRRSGHTRHFYLLYFAKWRKEGVTQGGFGPFFFFHAAEEKKFLCQNFVHKFCFSVLCSKSRFELQRIDAREEKKGQSRGARTFLVPTTLTF